MGELGPRTASAGVVHTRVLVLSTQSPYVVFFFFLPRELFSPTAVGNTFLQLREAITFAVNVSFFSTQLIRID